MSSDFSSIELFSSALLFTGVWQKNPDNSVSAYWNYASAEFRTDSSKIIVTYKDTPDAFIEIDGKEKQYSVQNNEVIIETDGKLHSIRIVGRYDLPITLVSVKVLSSAKVLPPEKRPYIHFIGDSITHFCSSFSFNTPKLLGADYSVVAQAGMSLHDGWGYYKMPEGILIRRGMETMYHKLEFPTKTAELTEYNFEICRVPDVIVIFLGTNDYLDCETHEKMGNIRIFAESYKNFVGMLKERFPDAKIYMLNALSDKYCRARGIEEAHKTISVRFPDVQLVRSNEWGVEISDDGTHPSKNGYVTLTENLAALLKNDLKELF